jgi:hypothetical protein
MCQNSAERFWWKVDRMTTPDGCWPWTGERNKAGYGRIKVNGRTRYAHNFALELVGFIIPAEFLQVRHYICHNPPCCRPSHLRIGTPQEDTDDKVSVGRQARVRGERNGQAKLRQLDVVEVRRLYAAGGWAKSALAQRFGVSDVAIGYIIAGRTWAHIV